MYSHCKVTPGPIAQKYLVTKICLIIDFCRNTSSRPVGTVGNDPRVLVLVSVGPTYSHSGETSNRGSPCVGILALNMKMQNTLLVHISILQVLGILCQYIVKENH